MSRRAFVEGAAAAALASGSLALGTSASSATVNAGATGPARRSTFFDIIRLPERVAIYSDAQKEPLGLERSASTWRARDVEVTTQIDAAALHISILAPSPAVSAALRRVQLRWKLKPDASLLYMGDAWERSYGDLAWRTMVPERVMPWYFAAHDDQSTHGYGVMTGPAAFCFWQVDPQGVSLWLDVSNGGNGVMLGQRELAAATVISREGKAGESPAASLVALCKRMAPHPRLPKGAVYGTNDWYYAYGENTAEGILRDTALVASLAPGNSPRPYSVIDDGWQGDKTPGAPYKPTHGFPDMARLAEAIHKGGADPGIWIRPTAAPLHTDPQLLLPASRFRAANGPENQAAYDPTLPEAMEAMVAKLKQVVDWKYKLVKHDYSTYDLLGQWGPEMGAEPARPGWSFHDRSRTNGEILLALYRALRLAAGDETVLLGCNTVGHLAAGLFEINRTGDDTSGRVWEQTRRMGVNTLSYRLPQNNRFFLVDADCVGITRAIPWEMNRQWMDLLARSGTALFISPSPDAIGPQQRAAIKEAFAIAASNNVGGYPTDWLTQTTPEQWRFADGATGSYRWCGEDGCNPSTT